MKASEFLSEANIIDKLKGAFKKSPGRTNWYDPTDPMTRDYETPAYQRKNAFLAKQAADAAAASEPKPSLPKMKVKKTDPRTALGMRNKGGSAEYQATKTDLGQQPSADITQPEINTPVSTPASKPTNWSDPAAQARLSKSIILALDKVRDPKVLNNINLMLQSKMKKAKA